MLQVREANFYKEGDITYLGAVLENCTIDELWKMCAEKSKFTEKLEQVETFNK